MKKTAMLTLGAILLVVGLVWMIALAVVPTAPQMTIFPAVIVASLGCVLVLIKGDRANDFFYINDGSGKETAIQDSDRHAA